MNKKYYVLRHFKEAPGKKPDRDTEKVIPLCVPDLVTLSSVSLNYRLFAE